jgi:hypothetical protein
MFIHNGIKANGWAQRKKQQAPKGEAVFGGKGLLIKLLAVSAQVRLFKQRNWGKFHGVKFYGRMDKAA